MAFFLSEQFQPHNRQPDTYRLGPRVQKLNHTELFVGAIHDVHSQEQNAYHHKSKSLAMIRKVSAENVLSQTPCSRIPPRCGSSTGSRFIRSSDALETVFPPHTSIKNKSFGGQSLVREAADKWGLQDPTAFVLGGTVGGSCARRLAPSERRSAAMRQADHIPCSYLHLTVRACVRR